jgi:zinc transport system permease protein
MPPDDFAGLPDPTWADFAAGWADLFREPVLCAVAAGLVLGFLSGYIVLRRMVFVSAVTTQSAGLGVALAFYVQIHHGLALAPSHGAVILAVGAAALLALDPSRLGLSREAVLGLVFAASGGGAVVVGDKISQEAHEIENILFGSAVMVEPADLYRVLIAGGLLLALHLCWFRGLTFASFDPVAARVQRVPVRLLDAFLFASIGIMVGVATQALGALPVFAMSTLPGIAALLVMRGRLLLTFAVAGVVGAASGFLGYLVSFFEQLPVGASQTVVASLFVAVALAVRLLVRRPVRLKS